MKEELLRLLREEGHRVKIGWVTKNKYGIYCYEKKKITINLALMITHILMHEYCHEKFPDLSCEEIWEKINKIIEKRLTVEEIKEIAREFLAKELKSIIKK